MTRRPRKASPGSAAGGHGSLPPRGCTPQPRIARRRPAHPGNGLGGKTRKAPLLWSRKPPPAVHDRSRVAGIDVTASRVRAVSAGGGRARPLLLDDPSEELWL